MSLVNHIIAKVSWETSFDWREKAFELQERLSSWSKIKMIQNINHQFDQFCPATQTWKIETLEVDLGKIDFNNLEAELSQQMNTQLNQKLIDLVINGNRDNLGIDIVDHATAQLNMLRYFLLNGVMPWSYQEKDGAIVALFARQLKENLTGLIALIREIGTISLEVRKRLAWQIDDYHISAVIKGLEPNNHKQIIDFSKEIIKIKNKENSIQGNSIDFKKNLWLWIFNYLLTERGTMFNKMTFMKSNMRQMAAHHNVSYHELLMLVDKVAHQINRQHLIKQEFITIINTLVVEEITSPKRNNVKKTNLINDWDLLRQYGSMPKTWKTKLQKNELNDLIVGLAKADQAKFRALILSFPKRGKWINDLGNVLTESGLATLLSAFNPTKSNQLLLRLQFLAQLNKDINVQLTQSVIFEIGLEFLQSNQHSTLSNAHFFEYYLVQLSKKSGLKKEHIAQKIIAANISAVAKTSSNLNTYQNFIQAIEETKAIKKVSVSNLIQDLIGQLANYPTNSTRLEILQSELAKNVQDNAKLTLVTLIKHAGNSYSKLNIAKFLDQGYAELLIKSAAKEKANICAVLQKLVDKFRKEKPAFANWIHENVVTIGLNTMVFYPRLSPAKFAEFILLQLSKEVKQDQIHVFQQYVQQLAEENYSVVKQILPVIQKRDDKFVYKEVDLLIAAKGDRNEIVALLVAALNSRTLSMATLQQHLGKEKITNYLLRNSVSLMQSISTEYANLLIKKLPKTKLTSSQELINEVQWKCLLDYSNHQGNPERFRKLYIIAMDHHLQLSLVHKINTQMERTVAQPNKPISLKNRNPIPHKELLNILQECLKNGTVKKMGEDFSLDLNEIIREVLAIDAKGFKKIWANIPLTKNRINILRDVIPFEEFVLWMVVASNGHMKNSLSSLKTWFDLVTYLFNGTVPENLSNDFWMLLWRISKTGTISTSVFQKFVEETLFQITLITSMNTGDMIAEIQKSKVKIPVFLHKILSQCLTNFSQALPMEAGEEVSPKWAKFISKDAVVQIINQLVSNQHAPIWFANCNTQETIDLLNHMVAKYQVQFYLAIKKQNLQDFQLKWLNENIKFSVLVKTIGSLNSNQVSLLQIIEQFYSAIGKLKSNNVAAKEIQYLLFNKLLKSWTNGNWQLLAVDQIWKELIWEVCVKKGIDQGSLIQSFNAIKLMLPTALQLTLGQLIARQQKAKAIVERKPIKKSAPTPFFEEKDLSKDSIFVQNAGLVLINHYIPMLFERLELTADKQFLSDKQMDAVHYLQFVATGLKQTEEPALALNKILCGIPLNQPIKDEILMSEEETELIEQLIHAMIGYWEAIGSTSIDGFRGNWLIRDGLIIEYQDKWELTIEKRAYDLLIHQSPFTFSIIKYPWMNKPLYVQWPH